MKLFINILCIVLVYKSQHCQGYKSFDLLHKCSWKYGAQPCPKYVPAPPGKTPPCARPGLTYCEHIETYPSQLIYHLIQRWQFNHQSLIIDESKDEFHALFAQPHDTYGPPSVTQTTVVNVEGDAGYHYSKPQGPGLSYGTPTASAFPVHNLTSSAPTNPFLPSYQSPATDGYIQTYKYTANIPSFSQQGQPNYYNSYHQNVPATAAAQGYYNDIWKRSERYNKTIRRRRALQLRQRYPDLSNVTYDTDATYLKRRSRQSQLQGQTLCRSRTSFIVPRAALNSKGNWMYVVNMPELDNRFTQQVKSETCIDRTCSNICGLPEGYSSKCEQKYVQKRLVALDGEGGDLYTDTFWFPSCCICTLSNT